VITAVAALLLLAGLGSAQEMTGLPATTAGQQSLRPYWHVFIAYAIGVVFVLGWVVSIARRLSALEDRLTD
jgi:hypothetical protein